MLLELSYVCMPTFIATILMWASYRHFYLDRLPEAICCCLQTYNVIDVLLIMYCMCLPAFFVTIADKSQLLVYLCYLLIYCLSYLLLFRNIKCLCGVVDVVMHNFHGHYCSLGTYRYI